MIEKDILNMKFACGIPLYHPTEEQLNYVSVYAKLFTQVYIYDNTENGITEKQKITLQKHVNVNYISTGDNDGLSHAYNVMCQRALACNNDYLAIYDQDSIPSEKYIYKLMDYIRNNRENDVAAYGPRICKSESDSRIVDEVLEVDVIISSGTFLNLNIYANTSGFDEDFFIDKVDDDYCLMVRKQGYKVKEVRSCLLYHKIGEHKKILGKIIEQHSPLRMYYIARNTMYLYSKYRKGKISCYYWLLDKIRHVLLYEDEKIAKVKMMINGAYDYEHSIMGKKRE